MIRRSLFGIAASLMTLATFSGTVAILQLDSPVVSETV